MISHKNWVRIFVSALLGMAAVAPPVAHAATFVVVNQNAAGVGFNDTTPAAPVGGNPGTTIGAQRLIAFQAAANLWGGRITSSVTIQVGAQFTPLACNASSAVLGSAGPANSFRDFTGAPVAGTWYSVALANSLHGSDLTPGSNHINANFNSTFGTTCPFPSGWYYGLDASPPGGLVDFFTVLVHELCHGLGFLTLVDLASGAKALGFNDAFMLNLVNNGASPPDYPSMTDAQRVAASIATGNLLWVGPNVTAADGFLTAGLVGTHARMFAPNPQQPGSSVSHWDQVLTPNQILAPVYSGPQHNAVLELQLLKDTGWALASAMPNTHDASGDGRSDIVWRDTSGNTVGWIMSGATVSSSGAIGAVPTSWSIVGQRDFNGGGTADLLWRDTSGNLAMWFMKGTTVTSFAGLGNVSTVWSINSTADFNGDGKGDLLWRDTSGNLSMWFMNGATVTSSAGLGNVSNTWTIIATADFNGDGKADILWRDASGNLAM
jgi:VCBS repeat protein